MIKDKHSNLFLFGHRFLDINEEWLAADLVVYSKTCAKTVNLLTEEGTPIGKFEVPQVISGSRFDGKATYTTLKKII